MALLPEYGFDGFYGNKLFNGKQYRIIHISNSGKQGAINKAKNQKYLYGYLTRVFQHKVTLYTRGKGGKKIPMKTESWVVAVRKPSKRRK